MGHSLSSAAQWTSAEEGGHGKLEFSPFNEFLLKEIANFVENISAKSFDESRFAFNKPLTWTTEIKPSKFTGSYKNRGTEILSEAVDKNGKPLLVLRLKDERWEISVSCFDQLGAVIRAAGAKKLLETRRCLEANIDPVKNILGDRFATVKDDQAMSRLTHEIFEQERAQDTSELNEKKTALNLLLSIKALDDALMLKAVKTISEEIKLNPVDVDREFNLLAKFCGQNSNVSVLKSLSWLQPYTFVFKNGCRAPFWRQLSGDIGYMVAHPHDKGPIYITASTNGYFVNGGLAENTKDLNFEKKSIFFKDLMSLLRKENAHFSFMIEQQDIFVLEEPTEEKRLLGIAHISPRVSSTRLTHHSSAGEPAAQILAGDKADSSGPMNEKLKSILSGGETKKDGRRHPKKTGKIKLDHIADRKHAKTDSTKQKSSGKKKHGEDSSSSGPDDNEEAEKCTDKFELPPDYWLIQKYMKFIRSGNPVATLFAISSMMDLDLNHDGIQLGIRDLGGVELLINLMEANDLRCQIGALHILKMISMNCAIRQFIADLGGIQIMVKLLRSSNFELRCLSAETIAHIARFRRARRIVRRNNGIANLIAMLDIGSDKSLTKSEEMEAARCAALAMFSCCKSHGNRVVMRQAGIVPILSKLLSLPDPAVLTPVVGILHECAQELQFLVSMRTEGMLGNIIKCLNEDGVELQTVCASALFVCATERESRDLIRQLGGLRRLVGIVSTAKDKKLLAAASGAIWKCAISVENCTELHKFEAIVHLVKLLLSQPEEPEEVLVNVVGALAEMAKLPINSKQIRQFNGVPPLISLLKKTNPAILINAAKAVGYCAEDLDNMALIDKLDGVALIWSLLKNPNEDVQASAARALCPCIQNAKDSGEMVRSFIGGLEFVVRLLKSSNPNVLASACAIIASIAKDEENLAVLTDHGVVPMLARLACTDSERLRHHLSEAIGCCCSWADNRVQFGKEDAVRPLVGFLRTTDEEVLRSCTKALHELSKDPDNCITMHDVGVVKRMLELVASRDPVVQVSAAGCISNIRRLALANENFHYQHIS